FYLRHDYEAVAAGPASDLIERLRAALPSLRGRRLGGSTVQTADDFAYVDPVDGAVSEHQGIRVELEDGARIVYRLSGTGTEGATLRVYLERFAADPARHASAPAAALAGLAVAAAALADIEGMLGRTAPSVVA
ncbi:MAG: alpha-D-glucose phosphate-specific phosphoglucomutase, partial [Stellaceae bacterium]